MTTPLSQFSKPEAEQYQEKRKLFLVPNYGFAPGAPGEGQEHLERYWTGVRDQVNNLERSLGAVKYVFHEMLFSDGDEGMSLLENLSPQGSSFIQTLCNSTASLVVTEDRALVEENTDWQRCLSIGLVSPTVTEAAMEGFKQTNRKRFEHIGEVIDSSLKEGEVGALFVREDHGIQFPSDIQVFYIAPPALDALKRWLNDQVTAARQAAAPQAESQ